MHLSDAVLQAAERLRPHVRQTPVERSPVLEAQSGGRVWLKLENFQRTGSFKLRGAMNKLLGLDPAQRERGVVAASSGNHGLAVASGAAQLGIPALLYLPEGASPTKLGAIRATGAEVRLHGSDCVEAERAARTECERSGRVYLSPYNDAEVVAGQGSLGVELCRQLDHVDAAYIAVGGGGLICGTTAALRLRWPQLSSVGASPALSPILRECVEAGRVIDRPVPPTLSDGTAGGVEEGSITLGWASELVDEWVDVDEAEIAEALRLMLDHHHVLLEGAAGVAVAAFRRHAARHRDQDVVIVLCGANISRSTLKDIL